MPDRLPEIQSLPDFLAGGSEVAIEAAGLGYFNLDPRTNSFRCNPFTKALFGLPEGDTFNPETAINVMHPDDRARMHEAIDRALKPEGDGKFEIEYRIIHPFTGELVYVVSRGQSYFLNGKVVCLSGIIQDITKNKKIEKALKLSNERFQLVTRTTREAIWDLDLVTDNLWWNDGFRTLFQLTEEEGGSGIESWQERLHPDDRQSVLESVDEILEKKQNTWSGEYRFRKSDGSYALVRDRGYAIYDEEGKPLRLLGSMQDITEQRIYEETLRESENRFRNTFENAAVGIAHVSLDGNWIMVNERLCSIVGYSREELLVSNFKDITHEDDLDSDLENVLQLIQGRRDRYAMDKRYIHKNGNIVWVHLTVSLVRDGQGRPDYFISVVQDISERKQTEEALRNSEKQLKLLSDFMPQIIWTTDATGNAEFFNKRWFEYTGLSPAQSLVSWKEMLHPDDWDKTAEVWKAAVRDGEDFEVEYRLKNAAGEFKWILARAIPIRNQEGEVIKWFGSSTDIHDQKTMSENLERIVYERTRELQRSNEDLQQFAHVASHDLKEPVRKVRTYTTRLQEEFSSLLPEAAASYLQKIEKATMRMYSMIDGVLLYSSLPQSELSFERVQLHQLLDGVLSDLEVLVQQKQALIKKDNLLDVEGMEVLVYQLMYNLLNNSLKFSHPERNPEISLSSRLTNIMGRSMVEIRISDNGIGFPPEREGQIFQTFTRLHSKDQYEGTGLGLALCKKIVERHGGSISAQGFPGEGAVFYVLLPACKD